MLPEHRKEWIAQAAADLEELPAALLARALAAGRKQVTRSQEFVAWVHRAVEVDMQKLREEQKLLRGLAEVVG